MYHIMAIGNALVDHEYRLTDAQLASTQLKKGNMTLADASQQQHLLHQLDDLGLKPSQLMGGGSAANAMYVIASLGGKCHYTCQVGDDDKGTFYLKNLNEAGVHTSEQAIHQGKITGTCVVCVSDDGERTMQTHLGASSDIDEKNIDFGILTDSEWLYFEGYLAMSEQMASAISKLRQQACRQNKKIAVSFADPAVVSIAKAGLTHMIGNGVDVIFCNLEEAQLFTKQQSVDACIQELLHHCHLAVVTQGGDGSVIGQKDADDKTHLTHINTPVVDKVQDTNGAGDNFAGAFLYALSQGHTLAQCGKFASHVASQVVQQFGARLEPLQYQVIAKQVLS